MCAGVGMGGSPFPPMTRGGGEREGKGSLAGAAGSALPEPGPPLSAATHPSVLPGQGLCHPPSATTPAWVPSSPRWCGQKPSEMGRAGRVKGRVAGWLFSWVRFAPLPAGEAMRMAGEETRSCGGTLGSRAGVMARARLRRRTPGFALYRETGVYAPTRLDPWEHCGIFSLIPSSPDVTGTGPMSLYFRLLQQPWTLSLWERATLGAEAGNFPLLGSGMAQG